MISIQGGPISIGVFLVAMVGIGVGLAHVYHVLRNRARVSSEPAKKHDLEESRDRDNALSLLSQNAKAVDSFVHDFGDDLFVHFDGESWLKEMTLNDIRDMVEHAVTDLVASCDCGDCVGTCDTDDFSIEAAYWTEGLLLRGVIKNQATSVKIVCRKRFEGQPVVNRESENLVMACKCTRPVELTIDELSKGVKPTCDSCKAKEIGGEDASKKGRK